PRTGRSAGRRGTSGTRRQGTRVAALAVRSPRGLDRGGGARGRRGADRRTRTAVAGAERRTPAATRPAARAARVMTQPGPALAGGLLSSDHLAGASPPPVCTPARIRAYGAARREARLVLGPAASPRLIAASVARPL